MPWLRVHARRLVTVALFALALQIVGGFGHLHLRHGAPSLKSSMTAILSFADSVSAPTDVWVSSHHALPHQGADGDIGCAICLSASLLASAVAASGPTLVLPVAYLLLGPPVAFAPLIDRSVPAAFWSRGPPLS